jgi:hypothetical protein
MKTSCFFKPISFSIGKDHSLVDCAPIFRAIRLS